MELPLKTGELLEKVLDRARDTTALQSPELVGERWSAQQADALVVVANAYLSGNGENEEGEPLSVGRKTRTIPTAIKRALKARDKGCKFPGCHHTRFVDAHHVKHWSAGGETSLDNLMLLCSRHHWLVHEGGFCIERDFQHRWFFRRPDGRAVPSSGYQAQDMTDDDINFETGELSVPINYPSAEGLFAAPRL